MMSTSILSVKKKDLQKISTVIQEFQSKILQDVDAAKLRDALNLTLLQMQTYWKVLKKKQDRNKADKYTWPWYDLRNPEFNRPQYLANSLYGAGVQKEKLTELFELLCVGDGENCQKYIEVHGYHGEVDSLGRGPLHYCAGIADLEHYVKFFASNGCNVNHQAHDGSTALHRAAINENPIVTDDLLALQANTSLRDSEGRTPAHWAIEADDTACLQLLIKYNADLTIADNDNESPAMWAARRGKTETMKMLLSSPVGPKLATTTDNKGLTLLHIGVRHIEIVNLFLNSDTVQQRDKLERNILHHAALQGVLDVCKLIGSQFDIKTLLSADGEGRTPVHHAVNNAHSSVTNYLLENGGSTNSGDKQGLTPHSIAQLKQLHYSAIVISAYHQGGENEPPKPTNRPQSPKLRMSVKPSFNQHPNDRRVVIQGSGLSKSTPSTRLKIQPPANLSTITPGLLRHASNANQQLQHVSQKPSRLRELTDVRDKITGRSSEHAPSFPQRPSSSRGKRNKRPSSPLPAEPVREGPPIPWKLNIIPPRPPPPKDSHVTNGHAKEEEEEVPERPRTARGNNMSPREEESLLQSSSSNIGEEPPNISPRYSKIEHIPPRKSEQVVIEETLEILHSLPDSSTTRGGSLLGPMPSLPGRQLPPDPNPWYKKKLNPVPPNKMDILQPENPGGNNEP